MLANGQVRENPDFAFHTKVHKRCKATGLDKKLDDPVINNYEGDNKRQEANSLYQVCLLKCHMALGHLVHAFRSLWTMIDPS
jgi:hypothetical protein